MTSAEAQNPVGLTGIEWVEFASPDPDALHALFTEFGFSRTMRSRDGAVDLYQQNDIVFLLNRRVSGFAASFKALHGPSICSMGWRVRNEGDALGAATTRGATASDRAEFDRSGRAVPAVKGIGDSLIYFIDDQRERPVAERYGAMGFATLEHPDLVPEKGFLFVDHMTNNVERGTMKTWSDFYKSVFGFTEVRYFDIRGVKTGLTSYALRSPDGSFCIPINEASDKKSQIQEYLEEYKGPGIQHLAFASRDILASLETMQGGRVQFLDIDDEYYDTVFERVPNVTEDRARIKRLQVLVDGDDEGYLLQIFTRNVVGPIFIEVIQRKNHHAFGEGNFGALFRSIERDQMRRGYLK
jgi:4-hydroxyphenylpyruvate dioxygenase